VSRQQCTARCEVKQIARVDADSNAQERAGARTPEGQSGPAGTSVLIGLGGAKADRDSEAPTVSASNRQNPRSA